MKVSKVFEWDGLDGQSRTGLTRQFPPAAPSAPAGRGTPGIQPPALARESAARNAGSRVIPVLIAGADLDALKKGAKKR